MNSVTEQSTNVSMTGLVEEIDDKSATGWVAGDADAFPARVELCLNDLVVSTTWADNVSEVNTLGETRSFFLGLKDIWSFMRVSDQISFRVDGEPIPISGKGMFCRADQDGKFTLDDLREKFADGYVFDRSGRLRLSKKLDTVWQSKVIALYNQVNDIIKQNFGYDVFVFYGSLLGQVREGGFIGHDDDFDSAYVSNHTDGPSAADELRDIGFALIDAGLHVDRKVSTLHIHDAANPAVRIDIFHTYFDEHGNLALPFGRAGNHDFGRDEWRGVTKGQMAGHEVLVPINAEPLVEHLYGENWKIPQVGFSWKKARTTRDFTGILTNSHREPLYWANFYARNEFNSGSTFFEKVNGRSDIPGTILDIGSGDGRDSFAFAKAGRKVIGLDRSHVGVEHATKKAEETGLSSRVSFNTCDVSDDAGVRALISRVREEAGGGPLLFYMRFFLHSIPEDVQKGLMSTLGLCSRKGDFIAAEFRTNKDKKKGKTHGKHYRRFQNGPAFGRRLRESYGFTPVYEEQGTGLSVYKDEDPHLYRVIARKGKTPIMVLRSIKLTARRSAGMTKRRIIRVWDQAS